MIIRSTSLGVAAMRRAPIIPAPARQARAAERGAPAKARAQPGDRTSNLDFLFGALKAAPDAESAKAIEDRIWALWLASGSDTVDLLMTG